MASLQVKNVDPELIRRVKIAAASEGQTLSKFILEALRDAIIRAEEKAANLRYASTQLPQKAAQ